MSRSFIGRLVIIALGGIIGASTFVIIPVLAGNPALAAGTQGARIVTIPVQTPPATVTPTVTPTPGAPFLTTDNFIPFLFILLPFGLILIAGLLFYIYRVQMKYYAATQSFSQMGVGVKAVPTPAFVALPGQDAASGPKNIKIDGPGFVAVGTAADFTATPEQGAGSSNDVNWKADPSDAASVSPTKGAKVTMLPLKLGSFKLIASIGDDNAPDAAGSVLVAAIAPKAASEDLPFIGQGYGSLVIAVLVVVAVIVLALTGVLAGEAVATLLGGLLGYIFGVTTAGGGGGGQPPKKTNGQAPTTSSA